jgi:hypothetical protein
MRKSRIPFWVSGALEEGGALVRREPGQRRLEDLAGDPKRERGLELRPRARRTRKPFG